MSRASRLLAGLFFCLPPLAAGAQQAPPQARPFVFQAGNKGDVLLHLTVLDDKDHNVGGLTAADFTFLENGVPQKPDFFAEEDAPVSLGVLIDASGSMKPKQDKVNEAALDFVRAGNPKDETFVVTFNDLVHLACGFTQDEATLRTAMAVKPVAATAIYDALTLGLQYEADHAKNDKRVLLLITDGFDNSSTHSLDATLRFAQSANGPMIYGLGLLDPDDIPEEHKQGQRVLKQIADATGGTAYFPPDVAQVDSIAHQIAQEIRAQYTVIYHSNQTTPGLHTIAVKAVNANGNKLKVRTRTGYYYGSASTGGN